MISEFVYVTIIFTVICIILQQTYYSWLVRLSTSILFVCVFYHLLNYYDYLQSGSIRTVKWKEGMIISYSYRTMYNAADGLFAFRLLGLQYAHSGVIVRDPYDNELKVLEWRQYDDSFDDGAIQFPVNAVNTGKILLIPIDYYIEVLAKKDVIFKVFTPPLRVTSVPFDKQLVDRIQDEGFIYCTVLVCRYLTELGYMNEPPVLKNHLIYYYPHTCFAWFRYNGWEDNNYVKK